ncbi:MAG: hypothetical protein ACOH2V_00645 [Candidatus Saccharimonadaceae bacterium]
MDTLWNFWEGIKNIIKWMPVIWRDRDFDYSYILITLKFKIKNTADYIEESHRYEGHMRDVERMRLCVRLIEAIQSDVYEMEYQDFQTYYDVHYSFKATGKDTYRIVENIAHSNVPDYIKKYPNDYRRMDPKYKEDHEPVSIALLMGYNRQKRAFKILSTLLERNLRLWWD